jgi:hypothetical protein
MRIAEMLQAIASWLESPDNEAILLAEYDDECLKIVSSSCVEAASALIKAANIVDSIEPLSESVITPESLDKLADIASAFDLSGDEELQKQASVIDELLLSIASPPGAFSERKNMDDKRLEDLKKKYNDPREALEASNKIADSNKAIDKSNMTKEYRIMESPLSARNCPDHAGGQLARVGENIWQCEMDKKIYNFATGFTLDNGNKVPGGDVSLQTREYEINDNGLFDSRESRLNSNKD